MTDAAGRRELPKTYDPHAVEGPTYQRWLDMGAFHADAGSKRFADTWPFTGKKTELLEGGLRIPAVISWPGRIPRGRTTDQVAISMDWLPTLVDIAGGSMPLIE